MAASWAVASGGWA